MASCGSGFSSGDTAAAEEVKQRMGDFWEETQTALTELQGLSNGFEEFSAGWDLTDVPSYVAPGVSSLGDPGAVTISPVSSYDTPSAINAIPGLEVHAVEIGAAPVNTEEKPTLYYPDQPEDLSAVAPTDKPDVNDVVIPDAPASTLPAVPTLLDVDIPTAEELSLPTWTETLPTQNISSPDYEFVFNETPYTSTVLTQVQAEVSRLLQGGTGLLDSTWQAIIDRSATRIGEVGARAILEAETDFASRGWSRPGGSLATAILQARQRTQNDEANLARDIVIKQGEMEQNNQQFALTQGIALESMLGELHNAYYERLLRAASLSIELAVQVMNAKIALYNAELAGYQTAATVYKTLIEAEIVKLEKFRIELEAQKLKNEINLTDVQLYATQIDAVQKQIDVFVAQLEGVKAQVEVDKTRMEIYRTEVDAYASQVDAWGKEWDGYTAAVNGQLAKVQNYQAAIQAFVAETEAYKAGIDGETAKVESDRVVADINIATLRADVERFVAEANASAQVVSADAQRAQAESSAYQASASFFSSKASAYGAELNAAIENARAAASISIDAARMVSQEIIAQTTIAERAWEAVLRTQTQIAASAMAAINVSASISSSGSQSESMSQNFNTDCSA